MKMKALFSILIMLLMLSCRNESAWQPLFNGNDLANWDKYIGTPLKGKDSLFKLATPENVFSVVERNGEKLIRISGTVNGSLATRQPYSNYHLKLVFRWGDSVYTMRNSGLLYHSFGDFGVALGTWMSCIECQLMHGNLGDTYLMNNTVCETKTLFDKANNLYLYDPTDPPLPFGKIFNRQSVKKRSNAEKPLGEWNTVELYSLGETTVHVVNGVTVMVNGKTGYSVENTLKPLTSGKIQLQSEGGELFIKEIKICQIKKIPEGIFEIK
jgi:hypothetical protein